MALRPDVGEVKLIMGRFVRVAATDRCRAVAYGAILPFYGLLPDVGSGPGSGDQRAGTYRLEDRLADHFLDRRDAVADLL